MAMDRAEAIGLGTAIGGHAVLLAIVALGLFAASDGIKKPETLEVSLTGEISDISTAPNPVTEAPAPEPAAAEAVAELQPEPVAPPEPKAAVPPKATAQKTAVQKKATPAKKTPAKTPPKKQTTRQASKSQGFGKNFDSAISGLGSDKGTGKKAGQVASKSASEVRRSVSVSLASQIRPHLQRCAPSGIDIDQIRTFLSLNLSENGALNSASVYRQTGINASNRPQAEPLKRCALLAARQAAPYNGLDPEYYSVWKTHKMQLKAR